MRILHVSNLYPPHERGGLEQICQEIVVRLRERGHVSHVLTSRYGTHGEAHSESDVTRALYLEADPNHYRPMDFFLQRPWQQLANKKTLAHMVHEFKPDIAFVWGMWDLSYRIPCWLEQWMPGRVAYNIASYWPLDADPHRVYWRNPSEHMLTRILLWPVGQLAVGILKATGYPPRPRFDHVSCCSQYVVDKLTDAGAIQPGAVAILNGIDPAPFLAHQRQRRAPHAPLHLLYFGSLIEHKGVHTAIEALGLMRQRGLSDGVDLTIVGGGQPDYEVKLRELTRSLTLEDRVRFVGRVPRSQIPQILSENDIYLFTSTWAEPFGRTIIEAMAAGLVVIGADVGGSREIFQHYPGNTLFEAGNAEALARQIERFVDDADLLDRLGEAGRRLVLERFTLDRMVDEMESWLKEIEA